MYAGRCAFQEKQRRAAVATAVVRPSSAEANPI
jgi:hypothetical protein